MLFQAEADVDDGLGAGEEDAAAEGVGGDDGPAAVVVAEDAGADEAEGVAPAEDFAAEADAEAGVEFEVDAEAAAAGEVA